MTGFAGRTHGELIQVGLAQADGAGFGKLLDYCGVVGRDEVVQHSRTGSGLDTLGTEQILIGQWQTAEWTGFAFAASGVGGIRGGQGLVGCGSNETVQRGVETFGTAQ